MACVRLLDGTEVIHGRALYVVDELNGLGGRDLPHEKGKDLDEISKTMLRCRHETDSGVQWAKYRVFLEMGLLCLTAIGLDL